MDRRLDSAWWALRIGLGLGPFLAGLDKFFNLLANWEMYLSPLALKVVPLSAGTFMRAVGIVEMIVGLAILTRWTRVGAYVAMVWLAGDRRQPRHDRHVLRPRREGHRNRDRRLHSRPADRGARGGRCTVDGSSAAYFGCPAGLMGRRNMKLGFDPETERR